MVVLSTNLLVNNKIDKAKIGLISNFLAAEDLLYGTNGTA